MPMVLTSDISLPPPVTEASLNWSYKHLIVESHRASWIEDAPKLPYVVTR